MAATEIASALAIVLALLFALRAGVRFAGLDAAAARGRSLRVVESVALGGRRRVMLLEAGDERLLLGSCETGLTLLRVLPPSAGDTDLSAVAQVGSASTDPQETLEADAQANAGSTAPARRRSGWLSLLPVLVMLFLGGDAAAAELGNEGLSISFEGGEGLSSSIELLALVTLVSIAPSILLMATCFTRVVIVLAFVRQAIGVAQLPPNQVLVGLALFVTLFVMAPLGEQIKTTAYDPYVAGELGADEAFERGMVPVRRYLMSYTREADLDLFLEMAQLPAQGSTAPAGAAQAQAEEPSLRVLLPAFLISELRTAFEIGFTIFLPFLVIDLVVASMLISMGMIVLPPIVVSLPFKIMLFVLIDGWNLVLTALVEGLR